MKRNRYIAIACLVAAVICGILAVSGFIKEKNAGGSYDALREVVTLQTDASGSEQGEIAVSGAVRPIATKFFARERGGKPETEENPINFDKLQELCPDAYAWIVVPDTQIDYPVVQSPTDNTFYLSHNSQGAYEFAGAIFTENYNSTDFTDPNTVIYGHNMKNGSMFRELHKFEDKKFFEEHPEFLIYTADEVLHYEIFAAYTYDDRHLLKEFDFSDREVFRLYLRDILGMRSMGVNIRGDVEVTVDDHIVTLSTCNGIKEQRYLVQGVLLSDRNM